jgi:tRNA-(ms[2]io[6]A)-hydroxylase
MLELENLKAFLGCETPARWVETALQNQDLLLLDHAHCEKKAAMSALNMIQRYPEDSALVLKMSRLAREELRHFEQVLGFIRSLGARFTHLSASRYASGLRDLVRRQEPGRQIDLLIVGAFIEARSCERFARIAPFLDPPLGQFYCSLLKSESRHYEDYLGLAKRQPGEDVEARIAFFRERESALIGAPDTQFRFHSGPLI